jgi:hypothetical protein
MSWYCLSAVGCLMQQTNLLAEPKLLTWIACNNLQ